MNINGAQQHHIYLFMFTCSVQQVTDASFKKRLLSINQRVFSLCLVVLTPLFFRDDD